MIGIFTRGLMALLLISAALPSLAQTAPLQLRDPFVKPPAPAMRSIQPTPPGAGGEAAPALPELRAIMFDHNRSLVNIGGAVLALGESVRGYRVIKINERSVIVSKGGTSVTLTLDTREAE